MLNIFICTFFYQQTAQNSSDWSQKLQHEDQDEHYDRFGKFDVWEDTSKYFTCVTKTIANLATYSRKPENYNGTIIVEFDIMKNSSPINLNLCQT